MKETIKKRHNPESNWVHRLHICRHSSLQHNDAHNENFAQPEEGECKASYTTSSIEPQSPSLLAKNWASRNNLPIRVSRVHAQRPCWRPWGCRRWQPRPGARWSVRWGSALPQTNAQNNHVTAPFRMPRCLLATSQPRVAEIARPGSNVPPLVAVWIEDGGAGGEGGREREASTKSAANSLADQKPWPARVLRICQFCENHVHRSYICICTSLNMYEMCRYLTHHARFQRVFQGKTLRTRGIFGHKRKNNI